MAEKPEETRSKLKKNLSIGVVLMLAAAMFSISAILNAGTQHRHPEDLVSLVRIEGARNQALEESIAQLQAQADELSAMQSQVQDSLPSDLAIADGVDSGVLAVNGPGMRIELSDAPAGQVVDPQFTVDDLVVHQQDLQAVINALWAGGAEAMTLQGQRVTALTAFRCVGNVLLLHGQVYSPPYVVEVIGDPDQLSAALDASEPIGIYKQYVAAVGLGWSAETETELEFPAAASNSQLKYASMPDYENLWK